MATQQNSNRSNPLTPLAVLAASWVVTKIAESLFKKSTGRPAPSKKNTQRTNSQTDVVKPNPMSDVMWSIGLTLAVSVTEYLVVKMLEDDKKA